MTQHTTIEVPVEVLPAEANEVIKQHDLATDTITTLTQNFQGFFAEATEWVEKAKAIEVTDITQTDKIAEAREMRLKLRKIRTSSEKTRKQLKEDSLRMGRAIDGMHNVLKAIVEPCEKHLKEQEDYIARLAEKRREELAEERSQKLAPYAEVCEPDSFPLGTMSEEEFDTLLAGAQIRHKQLIDAREAAEAERKAKEEAEAAEREKQRLEAEKAEKARIKAEAEAKAAREEARKAAEAAEAKLKAEREKLEAERKAIEAKARKEREEAEAKLAAERQEIEKAKQEAEAKARREEQARLQIEKEEAELKAKAIAEEKAAAQRPDKEKLQSFAKDIRDLEVPEVTTPEALKLAGDIQTQCLKFANWIEKQLSSL